MTDQIITTTTHMAGSAITFPIGPRTIQRCVVCGEKLIDEAHPWGLFMFGDLVEIGTNGTKQFRGNALNMREDDLPKDFCLMLVEKGL